VPWPARRLAGEERIEPNVGGRKGGRIGEFDPVDPLARIERESHDLPLKGRLAAEQICDHSARLAVAGGDRTCVEAGERADRNRLIVECFCIAFYLLQRDKLADL